ncbi:NAD(P)-binding protein [Flammula alnicola]|nr:NAD(P)-binding protein [Flammula alnicola]
MPSTCCQRQDVRPSNAATVAAPPPTSTSSDELVGIVDAAYSARAREGVTATYAKTVAEAFGYTEEELNTVPEGSHMGLSCGNPVATATIKEGETIVDLGSGGGIDVFLAADKVGPTGKAIGLDISEDMIILARANAAKKGLKPPHVAFVRAALTEPLPIEPESVDCVLSNCVVNLLPLEGKASLLKEVHRILKPGGRIVLDDIVAKKPLPDNIKNDLAAYVGCIAGAILVDEYKALLKDAGLSNVLFVDTKNDLSVYYQTTSTDSQAIVQSCCTPLPAGVPVSKPTYDINEWVASYQIFALKDGVIPSTNPPTALLRWWDAYPTVKSAPSSVSAEEVVALIRAHPDPATPRDFAVVDVRRNDHAGGHVRGSHNWHAQTFYDDLPSFFAKFKDTTRVIFYCQSSNGRGPRCAGWYQDYLDAHKGEHGSASYVLKGGIKNWLATFKGEEDLIDQD